MKEKIVLLLLMIVLVLVIFGGCVETSPRISVSSLFVDLDMAERTGSFTISNVGGGTLSWNITFGDAKLPGWLSIHPLGCDVLSGDEAVVEVNVDRRGLDIDRYNYTIFVISNGGNKSVNVNMDVIFKPRYYVDDDGGADFTKIQPAIDAASPGDTIYVYDGHYDGSRGNGNLIINKSIKLVGANKFSTRISDYPSAIFVDVIKILTDNVTVVRFNIMGGIAGINISGASNVTISSCVLSLNKIGISVVNSSNVTCIINYFFKNELNAYDESDSYWNSNYWDDYLCKYPDVAKNKNIHRGPYYIPGGKSRDNFPLVEYENFSS